MIIMDSPQDEEWIRKNSTLMAEEMEKENEYESLKKNGIPCDGCKELFMYNQLEAIEDEFEEIQHVCKDC